MRTITVLATLFLSVVSYANELCVNVYYDRDVKSDYWMGETYANLVQNLLGHFPEYQQYVTPIDLYSKGELDKCKANIYIGSYFNNILPEDFKADYKTTKNNVAMMGYNIWQLGEEFENKLGYQYSHLSTLNTEKLDSKGRPSFLKYISYKGEEFFKYGEFSKSTPTVFLAPFEQTILTTEKLTDTEVVSWATNKETQEKAPYILRNKNHFYIADVPLSFMHEADRYLILTDLLFDILGADPRHNGKYAFLRIEDVHPLVPLNWLYTTIDVLKEEDVQVNISLIPLFYDPLKMYTRADNEEFVAMDQRTDFMSWVRDVEKANGNFIWHGVTHQHKAMLNPHSGTSGDDFEFFDAVKNLPIAEDSVNYVLRKLDDGLDILKRANIKMPRIWLTPHYQASPLDYIILGDVFSWNVGRAIYYNSKATGLNESVLKRDPVSGDDERLWYETRDSKSSKLRYDYFKNLKINYQNMIWSGQMFPYEIYGDIYGQRLIPENLGNSQPFVNEHVTSPRTKEDMIKDAKRNLVLRDAWASFFYHPFLFTSYIEGGRGAYPGDPSELVYLIRELKKIGYQFVDINKFMDKNTKLKRKKPIYKEAQNEIN